MNIETRFRDKTTYFILVGFIIIAFFVSMIMGGCLYFQTLEFWEEATPCVIEQNFECLLNSITSQSIMNARIVTFITCIVSINGIIASFVFLMLFKTRR